MSKDHRLFINDISSRILIKIRRNQIKRDLTATNLQRELDISPAHTINVVNKMEEHGLIKRKKKGRSKVISITDDGKEIAEKLADIKNHFE